MAARSAGPTIRKRQVVKKPKGGAPKEKEEVTTGSANGKKTSGAGRVIAHSIRDFRVGRGFEDLDVLRAEVDQMVDVLLGRVEPPIERGVLTLMEVAEAYHARAAEITMRILRAEADGIVPKGSEFYRFRTGELRTFMDLCSKAIDLGSRRLTHLQVEVEMREEMP